MEVNGQLCTFAINGKQVAVIADSSASSVQDLLFSFASFVPGGTKYYLSDFTYTPLTGEGLDHNQAMQFVNEIDAAPYSTVAPGWNCNQDDGRWNPYYEPTKQTAALTCTTSGTVLDPLPTNGGALLKL